jgi:predicted transposase YdaD
MQEAVIYQDILQKGEQKGAFKLINRQLNRRFEEIDSSTIARIQALNIEQLEMLEEDFLSFSDVSNLVNWLDLHIGT